MSGLLLFLIPQFTLATLPMILLVVLIIVLFAALLWLILSKLPPQIAEWAKWVALVIGGILLLWFLISLVEKS